MIESVSMRPGSLGVFVVPPGVCRCHSAYVLKFPLNGREILDSGNREQTHHQRDPRSIHDRPKGDSQKNGGR